MTGKLRVEFHAEAVREAGEARSWYADRSQSVAAAFLDELDHAVERLSSNPEAWPGYVSGTRRYVLRRFPFYVVYRVTASAIQVLAVAHGLRRPGYWRDRSRAE
ncbi:MAG: type II toxin-antitoxin system RelE/ParE family toxin [bacterium]